MTQIKLLDKYFRTRNSITTLQAVEKLGILRLSERIREMEAAGYLFDRVPAKVKNRFGKQCNVMKYCLWSRP